MLINPVIHHSDDILVKVLSNGRQPENHAIEGYIVGFHWNPEFHVQGIVEEWPNFDFMSCYGTCDNPYQFDRKFGFHLRNLPDRYFVSFVQILKSEQPPSGGWRWHKWGPYEGEREPRCEYLYDEPIITEAWTYHVYQV